MRKLFNSVFAPISDASRRCNIAEFLFQAEKLRDKSHFLLTEKHFNDRKKYKVQPLVLPAHRGGRNKKLSQLHLQQYVGFNDHPMYLRLHATIAARRFRCHGHEKLTEPNIFHLETLLLSPCNAMKI